jgi:hypothetical protein
MKHLPESLGALGVEGRVDGARSGGSPAQRRLKSAFVKDVDGVAGALRVAPEAAGDLVGILAPVAGEKYLATSEDESIRRAQACLQGHALGVAQRTHEDWSSDVVEDNSSTTASSEHALAILPGSSERRDELPLRYRERCYPVGRSGACPVGMPLSGDRFRQVPARHAFRIQSQ